ncbi:MAG: Rieske 2Fe-2S domain-containing protein [Chloroflexota bacterium]|nr:Rieske 2Fe-2S domain-containing protein [Chloroflexota bacterium]
MSRFSAATLRYVTGDAQAVPRIPLSRASTLPKRYYLEPAILEAEKERVFGRTWQLVARADELQRVGDFVPGTVLDEPVVITHGLDGQLRAFYNVCRHRAGQVALTRGNRKSLQCRYHGWTYGLDGTLRACPEMEETEDFRKEDFGLMPIRVDRWGPFVFVNLSADAPPLREVMGAIPAEVASAGYDVDRMRPVERREYLIECNWKVYVDNYLEGYHLPIAHPQLYKELDYDSYRVEEFRYYSKQHAPIRELKPGEEPGRDRRYLRSADGEDSALYYWLFPNTMFNIYQDNMSSNVILPMGPDRTLTIFEWFFAEPGSGPGWESMQQTIAFSDEIQQEDIVICEQVQRGLRSRSYEAGRFSAKRENGVYHFQNLVREFLGTLAQ